MPTFALSSIRFPIPQFRSFLKLAIPFACVAVLLGLPLRILAQTTAATLSGTITDQRGALVPGVAVTITNEDTGVSVATKTNGAGIYSAPGLNPGHYRVVVERQGFKQVDVRDLTLNVQDVVSRNFTLEVGGTSETVQVNGSGINMNTTDGSVSTVVDSQFVENMPLNGRSFQSLLELTPGVTPVPGGTVGQQGEFSVNGQRTESNYYTVDGVSANTGAQNLWSIGGTPQETALGTTQSMVSVDDLQEFRISTSTYSAEYGRNPGAQISLQTRSGSNSPHGSTFDYLRNDAMDANNWFNDNTGTRKTAERQNDFGGTFGGPVYIAHLYNGKDKTFFFFSYEGLRLVNPQPALTVQVPDKTLLTSLASSPMLPLLEQFPVANGPDLGDGVADFTGSYSAPSNLNATSIRIDHTFGSKLSVFGRFAYTPSLTAGRGQTFVGVTSNGVTVKNLTMGANSLLSPHVANEARLNYTTSNSSSNFIENNFAGETPLTAAEIFPGITPPINYGFTSYFSFLNSQPYIYNDTTPGTQWNVVDSLSSTFGAHTVKYGIDYLRQSAAVLGPLFGDYLYYNSLNSVVTNSADFAEVYSAGVNPTGYSTNFSAFVQDEWKATRRLHLSLGLRWDLNPPQTSNLPLYAITQITDLATTTAAAKGTPIYHTDYRGFAPRFGIAYSLPRKPGYETVLRSGFGVFYDTGAANGLMGAGQGASSYNVYYGAAFPFTPAEQVVPTVTFTPPYNGFNAPDPYLKLPYTLQWNAAIQQQLGASQSLTVTYLGSGGRKLLQSELIVVPTNNPNFLPGSQLESVINASSSSYNALQVQFQRNLARGLQALASYTWSHSIDNLSSNGELGAGVGDFNGLNRASSDFDLRHNFSAAVTYDIPGSYENPLIGAALKHWGVDLRQTASTAQPVDIRDGYTFTAGRQEILIRPYIVPGMPLYLSEPAEPGKRVFNYNAFSATEPTGSTYEVTPRNLLRGFNAIQTDLAIRREFPITERLKMQFRAESFNIMNHPMFGGIATFLPFGPTMFGIAQSTLNSSLGGLNALYQMGGPRSLQVALKLRF